MKFARVSEFLVERKVGSQALLQGDDQQKDTRCFQKAQRSEVTSQAY